MPIPKDPKLADMLSAVTFMSFSWTHLFAESNKNLLGLGFDKATAQHIALAITLQTVRAQLAPT